MPDSAQTRAEQALAWLRTGIIDGSLLPATPLPELAVARRLGVSRMPVREALFALEREGLVEFSPSGRAHVRDLTAGDFAELFDLRLIIEPAAAWHACSRFGSGDLERLAANISAMRQAGSLDDLTRLDLDFHEAVVEISGNSRLARMWRSIRGELQAWLGRLQRAHRRRDFDTRGQTVSAHGDLLECLRTGSPAACRKLMRHHILGWRKWLPG